MSDTDEKQAKTAPRRKLGRGLGALMGETRREEPLARRATEEVATETGFSPAQGSGSSSDASVGEPVTGLKNIDVSQISPLPGQPRTHFDEDALAELAASIEARGVIQPIIVRPWKGKYQLVAGERRWRAAQRARLHRIPAIVRELDEREVMALALIENLQREDLNPVEEARAYHKLAEDEDMTQAEIARMVDKSRSHVANFQRLLALPEDVLDLLAAGGLSMGHARALIGNENASDLARTAVADSLSVREVERLAKGASPKKTARPVGGGTPISADNADLAAVQAHLEEFLGMSVKIKPGSSASTGTVSIAYRTLDQLDLLCQRLTGGEI